MKPNADGYGAAFLGKLLMSMFLLIQWWSFGVPKDPRRVAFDKLSAEEQTGFLQAGAESKHKVESIQKQLGELQMNTASGKKVLSVVLERIMKFHNELMKAEKQSQEFVVPEL